MTLTLGVAYLTVLAHERNRQSQALALRSQSRVLQSLIEPNPLPPPQTRAELAREERSSLIETAKDRWNDEIENAVRWVQKTDWEDVREGVEGAVSRLLSGGLQKSRDGIETAEKAAAPRIHEAVDFTKAKAAEAKDRAALGIDKAAAGTIAGVERTGSEVKAGSSKIAALAKEKTGQAKAEGKRDLERAEEQAWAIKDAASAKAARAGADTKGSLHEAAEAVKHSGGTVVAARGAVRDVISKGIEKGKAVVGKAQEAVGLATEQVEAKVQSATGLATLTAQEIALQKRYAPFTGDSRTPEQVLAERYTPIDARSTVLPAV